MLRLYTSRLTGALFFPILIIFPSLFLPRHIIPISDHYRRPWSDKSHCTLKEGRLSVTKTELIDWRTLLDLDSPTAPCPPPVALDRQIFHPSKKLPWLGYWFVPNLAASAQFSLRLALSQAAFSVQCPSDAGKGISPHLRHRLDYYLMFPILSYRADLFTPTRGLLNKMEVHWRQVQRWVTNCF